MVRATYARVLVRTGGSRPAGWSEAAITALCTNATYLLDGFTHPDTLSTTDNECVEIEVDLVLNLMAESSWLHAGGYLTGKPKPEVFTQSLKERIAGWLTRNNAPIGVVDMVGPDSTDE